MLPWCTAVLRQTYSIYKSSKYHHLYENSFRQYEAAVKIMKKSRFNRDSIEIGFFFAIHDFISTTKDNSDSK